MCSYYSIFCILTSLRIEQPFLNTSVLETSDVYDNVTFNCRSWYMADISMRHYYNGSLLPSTAPLLSTKNYKLTLMPELYDVNTTLICSKNSKGGYIRTENFEITPNMRKASTTTASIIQIKYYRESVDFDCSFHEDHRHRYVHVTMIQENNITIIHDKKWQHNFTEADNGTILCCYVYAVRKSDNTAEVTRYIYSKTILIHSVDFNIGLLYLPFAVEFIVLVITLMGIAFCLTTKRISVMLSEFIEGHAIYENTFPGTKEVRLSQEADDPVYSSIDSDITLELR